MKITGFLSLLFTVLAPATASWWLLAMPSAYQMTLNFNGDYKSECHRMNYLVARQRELCTLSKNMLALVSQGAQMGLKECQNQFSGRHWNCSTTFDNHLGHLTMMRRYKKPIKRNRTKPFDLQSDSPAHDVGDVFGGILKFHSREKAYVHAISAAGVAYTITRACSQGRLPSCSCDRNVHLKKNRRKGTWEWGGCSEDVAYGERLSKDFVDSNDLAKDWGDPAPKMVNLHNNEAGRKALRKNMQLMCKCHGVSGSCTTKICWRKMRDFHNMGETLFKKFDGAVRVKFSLKRHKLKPASQGHKKPRKRDLVYLEESPDYCHENRKYGIIGTKGRRCNLTSYGIDNCRVLCCGRGYSTVVVEEKNDCDCKFVWCCEVKCSICKQRIHEHYCR